MKKYRLWHAASHACVVLGIAMLTLFVIDRINPAMGFIGSDQGDWLLLMFCICSVTNGCISAAYLLRRDRYADKLASEARHDRKE